MTVKFIKYFDANFQHPRGNPDVVLEVPGQFVAGYFKYNSVNGKLEPNTGVDSFVVEGEKQMTVILDGLKKNSDRVESEDVEIDSETIDDLAKAGTKLAAIQIQKGDAKDEVYDCMQFCIAPK